MKPPRIDRVTLRLATADDAHLPAFDNTKLVAAMTCPTWGVIRYGLHKTMAGSGRAMALEAGSAMHRFFAAVRLLDWLTGDHPQLPMNHVTAIWEAETIRCLGQECYDDMFVSVQRYKDEDFRTKYLNTALCALYTSGYYDDPSDRRRTMSNLEEAAISYFDRWQFGQHYAILLPDNRLTIEIPFDVVVDLEHGRDRTVARFTGKIDGIRSVNGAPVLDENKTASRLDDAWRESFHLSSQITGYIIAASLVLGQAVEGAYVYGTAIPQPRNSDYGGQTRDYVTRTPDMLARWFEFFLYGVRLYLDNQDEPLRAPRYYHSCNRYFRPCSFIPLCASDDEEQERILEEMVEDEWNPLHDTKGLD